MSKIIIAMQIIPTLAQHLLEVTNGGNWTEVSIMESLKDVNHTEACLVTDASVNTIASLVHHLTYWNRVMIQRINGTRVVIPDSNGFDVPAISNETEWKALQEDHVVSAHELAAAILTVDENKLDSPILEGYPSYYKSLQGMVEHAHYHLGQIVVIGKLAKKQLIVNS